MSTGFLDQIRDPDAPPPVQRKIRRETTFKPYASVEGEGGPLRIGTVFAEAWALYGSVFPVLIGLALIIYLPASYVYFLDSVKGPGLSMPAIVQIVASGGGGLQWALLEAAYLVFASVWCLDAMRQTDQTTGQKLMQGLQYLLPGLGVLLIYKIALALGLVFFVVPGLMIATFAAVLIPALVSGDRRRGGRLWSWQMVSGYGWPVFGILAVLLVLRILMFFGSALLVKMMWTPFLAQARDLVLVVLLASLEAAVLCSLYVSLYRKKFGSGGKDIEDVFS